MFALCAFFLSVAFANLLTAPLSSPAFVKLAGAGHLFELTSSQVLLSSIGSDSSMGDSELYSTDSSPSPSSMAIAEYAARMAHDHRILEKRLMAETMRLTGSGSSESDRVHPRLDVYGARKVRDLVNSTKKDISHRDRTYLTQQIESHQLALAIHHNYARTGQIESLVALAEEAIPVLESHLEAAKELLEASEYASE